MKPYVSLDCIDDLIRNEKETIYAVLFYVAGLLLGSLSFGLYNSTAVINLLSSLYSSQQFGFTATFTNAFTIYISVFLIVVFSGLFLIGYPVIYAVPVIIGIAVSVKTTFFFTQYGAKGIGYSLLMIIPECSAFVAVIICAIRTSSLVSEHIQKCTFGDKNGQNIKPLIREYAIYALSVTLISVINALLTNLFGTIIKI